MCSCMYVCILNVANCLMRGRGGGYEWLYPTPHWNLYSVFCRKFRFVLLIMLLNLNLYVRRVDSKWIRIWLMRYWSGRNVSFVRWVKIINNTKLVRKKLLVICLKQFETFVFLKSNVYKLIGNFYITYIIIHNVQT